MKSAIGMLALLCLGAVICLINGNRFDKELK